MVPPSKDKKMMFKKKQPVFAIIPAVLLGLFLVPKVFFPSRSLTLHEIADTYNANSFQGQVQNTKRVCHQNPYVGALESSLEKIAGEMDSWLENIGNHVAKGSSAEMTEPDHSRFFPFEVMSECKEKSCVGGPCRSDTSKIVCGLDQLQKETGRLRGADACIVYSIGGNNQWEFESDLLEKTPCEIHTFDCTGSRDRFIKPDNARLHFHHVCLGTQHESALPAIECKGKRKCGETWTMLEMQQKLKHTRIDLFKIDIEGFEWPLLESWPAIADSGADGLVLPMQILMEVHYRTPFTSFLSPGNKGEDFRWGRDMVNLQAHLLRMGYTVVQRDDNKFCYFCTELTLVRTRCPATGAYATGALALSL
jgi:hypothetical protein